MVQLSTGKKPLTKLVNDAGGWMCMTDKSKAERKSAAERKHFLSPIVLPRARRIAATLYDAKPEVQAQVLKAFGAGG